MPIPIKIIVAMDQKQGIGINGQLPWQLSKDMRHFKDITTQTQNPAKKNIVVMGRKTWESIPERFRPLTGRHNIILSRQGSPTFPKEVFHAQGYDQLFEMIHQHQALSSAENMFFIGGASIFKKALSLPECQSLYITHIEQTFDCDVFFPPFHENFEPGGSTGPFIENDVPFRFVQYHRKTR
ncbi:MAG: dihydrofolate reductase [Candidatus Omnitrophica bacterium]|nr:dihydrofolate reductase [Candidatus Omnitrophota bacterium]